MAYIPAERTLRLVEIQFTVLPEAEWLLGITDLSYFQGVGFSLPIPFDVEDFSQNDDQGNDVLQAMAAFSDPGSLYAFLPGLFYCSKQNTTVDGILVEVAERELLGMNLSSFRPEGVRSFDIQGGFAVDESGTIHSVEMSMETIGKFATGLSEKISSLTRSFLDTSGTLSLESVGYMREMEIAGILAELVPLKDLKRAYVSGAILTGQVLMLLHDMEFNGLKPRHRIYVKNQRYPEGHVVVTRYPAIDESDGLGFRRGIEFPEEIDLGLELMKLSFAKLIGDGKEVEIEEAILDTYETFYMKLGANPPKDRIVDLIFSEEPV
jgi:hypothetical protein